MNATSRQAAWTLEKTDRMLTGSLIEKEETCLLWFQGKDDKRNWAWGCKQSLITESTGKKMQWCLDL